MIGRGRFRCLTNDLDRPGVPYATSAVRFARLLKERCGCILTWNAQRRVFCVVRSRGEYMPLVSYFDINREDLPFNTGLLHYTVNAIRFYDARAAGDPMRAMKQSKALSRERWEAEREKFIEERVPDFIKDLRRATEIISDGRYRPKFFDTAGKRLRASA